MDWITFEDNTPKRNDGLAKKRKFEGEEDVMKDDPTSNEVISNGQEIRKKLKLRLRPGGDRGRSLVLKREETLEDVVNNANEVDETKKPSISPIVIDMTNEKEDMRDRMSKSTKEKNGNNRKVKRQRNILKKDSFASYSSNDGEKKQKLEKTSKDDSGIVKEEISDEIDFKKYRRQEKLANLKKEREQTPKYRSYFPTIAPPTQLPHGLESFSFASQTQKPRTEKERQEHQDMLLALQIQHQDYRSPPPRPSYPLYFGSGQVSDEILSPLSRRPVLPPSGLPISFGGPPPSMGLGAPIHLGAPFRGRGRGGGRGRFGGLYNLQYVQRDFTGDDYELLLSLDENVPKSKAASEKQISQIEEVEVTDNTKLINNQCSICLDDIIKGNMIKRLTCSHAYHSDCIDRWLKESRKCPICNLEITFEDQKQEKKRNH